MNGEANNSRFVSMYVYMHLAFKAMDICTCMYLFARMLLNWLGIPDTSTQQTDQNYGSQTYSISYSMHIMCSVCMRWRDGYTRKD